MDKKIMKSDDTEIEKYKYHQNKSPISINDIDVSKKVVNFPLVNKILNISLVTNILKKSGLYAYSVHK